MFLLGIRPMLFRVQGLGFRIGFVNMILASAALRAADAHIMFTNPTLNPKPCTRNNIYQTQNLRIGCVDVP